MSILFKHRSIMGRVHLSRKIRKEEQAAPSTQRGEEKESRRDERGEGGEEMESAREARRRKILERGSDRIALITAAQTRSENPPTQQSDQTKPDEVGARDENSGSHLIVGGC